MAHDDPFAILGLEPTFDLDPAEVERSYLSRVASGHPDLGGDGPEAGDDTARLNHARRTLLDPEARASALLTHLGHPAGDVSLPEGFLLEIMDARMEYEQAAAEGDRHQLEHWQRWARERRHEAIGQVAGLFRRHRATGEPEVLGEIKRTLNAWRYIERMIEQGRAGTR